MQVDWLFSTAVDFDTRMARWGGQLAHDLQEPTKTLAMFEGSTAAEEADRIHGGRESAHDLLDRAGFTLKLKRQPGGGLLDEASVVTYNGVSTALQADQMSERMASFMFGGAALWATSSGAAHTRVWFTSGIAGDAWTILGAILLPLLDAADGLTQSTCAYLGGDDSAERRRTHRWRVAMNSYIHPESPHLARANADGYQRRGKEMKQESERRRVAGPRRE